ncbi:MAG: hypothetical protein M1833_005335 [Piccolia ochrophora]|nr:MAG: hypothetical protein M1833_005335 [Piccolia ochrophora]
MTIVLYVILMTRRAGKALSPVATRSEGARSQRATRRSLRDTSNEPLENGDDDPADRERDAVENQHRSKRIKTQDEEDDDPKSSSEGHLDRPISEELPSSTTEQESTHASVVSPRAMMDLASAAIASSPTTVDSPAPKPEIDSAESQSQPPPLPDGDQHRPSGAINTFAPSIDFSSAPSDPTDLALWVARQISNFQGGRRSSLSTDASGERLRHFLHPPAIFTRRFDDDDDPIRVAERERVREENRERKKRWRESNAERNKDNDLRCRINKRAKQIWGSKQPAERSAWIEAEFNKRRAKRESKEKVRSFDEMPNDFAFFSPGFGSALFPAPGVGPQGETNAAGLLLANALLGVGSDGAGPNAGAANALKAALEGGTVDPKPFTEALRAMAGNPEIMRGINAILGGYSGFEDNDVNDVNSGDEDAVGVLQTTETQDRKQQPASSNEVASLGEGDDQEDIVKALNAATAMLNQMNEAREEEGHSKALNGEANGFTAINGETDFEMPKALSPDAGSLEQGLDQKQIDALLTLANGGAPLREMQEADQGDQHQDSANGSHQDNDISATLQRIIQQVMAQKDDEDPTGVSKEKPPTNGVEASPSHSSQPANLDPFGVAKNPALALSSLLHCAGMSINTVIPAAQSHATSQLYARLSNHSRSSTPSGGGINPAHASAFGSTMAMNQKLLARPNAFNRPLQQGQPAARAAAPATPPKQPNPTEDKRIKSFGFPPMPGSRLKFARRPL